MNIFREMIVRQQGGWAPQGLVEKVLKEAGFKIKSGEWDNHTDGEVHIFISRGSDKFEFHGNCWDARTFIPLVDWLDSL